MSKPTISLQKKTSLYTSISVFYVLPNKQSIKAIQQNQLTTWPGLTETAVDKYIPDISPSTNKGHMKRQRNGIKMTQDNMKDKLEVFGVERDIQPPIERDKMNQNFTSIPTVERNDGTIYVDNKGNFPIRSIKGGGVARELLYQFLRRNSLRCHVPESAPSRFSMIRPTSRR